MAEVQEIDVQIGRDGEVKIEVRGVSGRKCRALTARLEQLLGGAVKERFYQDTYHHDTTSESEDLLQDQGTG